MVNIISIVGLMASIVIIGLGVTVKILLKRNTVLKQRASELEKASEVAMFRKRVSHQAEVMSRDQVNAELEGFYNDD